MGNKQSGRMLSQDIAKGLCIISVVLLHTFAMPIIVRQIIFSVFSYALSFFFIISGYNYHGMKMSYGQTIWKRFKQLFIPFGCIFLGIVVIFGPIGLIFYNASWKDVAINGLETLLSIETFININANLVSNVKAFLIPSWFVFYMFAGYVVFYAIADWSLKSTKKTFLVIAGLVAVTFGLCILQNLNVGFIVKIYAFPWVKAIVCAPLVAAQLLLGAFLGKKQVFAPKETKKGKGLNILFSILSFAISAAFGFFFPLVGSFAGGNPNGILPYATAFGIWEVPITFVTGFLFTYYFVNFCRLIERIPVISKWLIFNGQHTMEIYLIHYPLSILIRHIFGLVVDPIMSIPCEFPPEVLNNFDYRYIFVFVLTLAIVDVLIYLYYLVKKIIKDKKNNQQTVAAAN